MYFLYRILHLHFSTYSWTPLWEMSLLDPVCIVGGSPSVGLLRCTQPNSELMRRNS